MAVFNPTPPPTNDPTYGQSSRIHQSEAVVDRTYGTLFEGLGEIVDATAKGMDFAIKQNINEDLYREIDEERDAFGVGDTAAMASLAGSPLDRTKEGVSRQETPPELNHLGPQVERLTQAHQAGKLSSRYYYARLEAIVRSMRARYPGYRDYIDQKVSDITGVTPANALRSSILQELEALSSEGQKESDQRLQLAKWGGEFIGGPATEAMLSGRMSKEQYVLEANRIRKYKQDMTVEQAEWSLLDSRDKGNKRQIEQNLNNRARILVNEAYSRVTANYPGGFEGFQKIVDDVSSGRRTLTDTEIAELTPYFQSFENFVRRGLRNELMRPDKNGNTPDPETVNKLVEQHLSDLTDLKGALSKDPKDFQIAGMASRRLKTMSTDTQMALSLDNRFGSWVNTSRAWKEILGEQAFSLHAMQTLGQRSRAIMEWVAPTAATQGEWVRKYKESFTAKKAMDVFEEQGEAGPGVVNALIELAEKIKDDKQTTIPMSLNLARFMFSPENMNFIQERIEPKYQVKAYTRLTSEDMVKRMVELDKSDPTGTVLENFKFWAKNEFSAIFGRSVKDAQDLEWNKQINLTFNPETGRFNLHVPEDLPGGSRMWYNSYKPIIDELNQGISTLKNVLALDGQDVPSYLLQVLAQNGYRPGAEPPPGFFKTVYDLLYPRIVAPKEFREELGEKLRKGR